MKKVYIATDRSDDNFETGRVYRIVYDDGTPCPGFGPIATDGYDCNKHNGTPFAYEYTHTFVEVEIDDDQYWQLFANDREIPEPIPGDVYVIEESDNGVYPKGERFVIQRDKLDADGDVRVAKMWRTDNDALEGYMPWTVAGQDSAGIRVRKISKANFM